jgi:hypothetical protein
MATVASAIPDEVTICIKLNKNKYEIVNSNASAKSGEHIICIKLNKKDNTYEVVKTIKGPNSNELTAAESTAAEPTAFTRAKNITERLKITTGSLGVAEPPTTVMSNPNSTLAIPASEIANRAANNAKKLKSMFASQIKRLESDTEKTTNTAATGPTTMDVPPATAGPTTMVVPPTAAGPTTTMSNRLTNATRKLIEVQKERKKVQANAATMAAEPTIAATVPTRAAGPNMARAAQLLVVEAENMVRVAKADLNNKSKVSTSNAATNANRRATVKAAQKVARARETLAKAQRAAAAIETEIPIGKTGGRRTHHKHTHRNYKKTRSRKQ